MNDFEVIRKEDCTVSVLSIQLDNVDGKTKTIVHFSSSKEVREPRAIFLGNRLVEWNYIAATKAIVHIRIETCRIGAEGQMFYGTTVRRITPAEVSQ